MTEDPNQSANSTKPLEWPAPKSGAVSAVMRGNAVADTSPEMVVRSKLHLRGLRFRKRVSVSLPGHRRWTRPDATFPRERVALFVDGCFWHGCPQHGTKPRNNPSYWGPKLARNKARDEDTDRQLGLLGWDVIRAWEHEDPEEIADRVEAAVRARRTAG